MSTCRRRGRNFLSYNFHPQAKGIVHRILHLSADPGVGTFGTNVVIKMLLKQGSLVNLQWLIRKTVSTHTFFYESTIVNKELDAFS